MNICTASRLIVSLYCRCRGWHARWNAWRFPRCWRYAHWRCSSWWFRWPHCGGGRLSSCMSSQLYQFMRVLVLSCSFSNTSAELAICSVPFASRDCCVLHTCKPSYLTYLDMVICAYQQIFRACYPLDNTVSQLLTRNIVHKLDPGQHSLPAWISDMCLCKLVHVLA